MGRDSNVRSRRNGNHRKSRLLPWFPQQRALAGFVRATLAGVMRHSISIRPRFIRRLILLVAGLGIIFLASAVQTFGKKLARPSMSLSGAVFSRRMARRWRWAVSRGLLCLESGKQ
jgi:hypothetical protein